MFCEKCGTNIPDGINVCPACGNVAAEPVQAPAPQPYVVPVQPQPYAVPAEKPAAPGKGLAIASMVLGIISLLCYPVITGVLAIIFGAVAKSKGCKSGMATAGIVCGIIGLALWLIMLIAFDSVLLLFSEMFSEMYY